MMVTVVCVVLLPALVVLYFIAPRAAIH
jgi:hypothetical protein